MSSKSFRYNEIAAALVADPAEVPDLVALVGMFGPSSRQGYSRVYLTIDLCDFIEIPDDDVMHVITAEKSVSPLSVNTIWVRRDTKYIRMQLQTRDHRGTSSDWTDIPIAGDYTGGSDCKYLVDKIHL